MAQSVYTREQVEKIFTYLTSELKSIGFELWKNPQSGSTDLILRLVDQRWRIDLRGPYGFQESIFLNEDKVIITGDPGDPGSPVALMTLWILGIQRCLKRLRMSSIRFIRADLRRSWLRPRSRSSEQ